MATIEPSRLVRIDDTDPRLVYSDGWETGDGDTNGANGLGNFGRVYQNTLHYTSAASASVSFTFTGEQATFWGTTDLLIDADGTTDPEWDCILDGVISASSKRPASRQAANNWRFCYFSDLSDTQHTVQLVVRSAGQPFYVDYVNFRPAEKVEGETVIYHRIDQGLVYEGIWRDMDTVAEYTRETGASVSLRFVGRSLSLYSMAAVRLPRVESQAAYSIDGADEVVFTIPALAGSLNEYNQLVWESPELPPGEHNVTLTYRGSSTTAPLSFDKLVIAGSSNALLALDGASSGSESGGVTSVIQPAPSGQPSPSSSGAPAGAIVGGVLGGMALVIISIALFIFFRRLGRKRYHASATTGASPDAERSPATPIINPFINMEFANTSGASTGPLTFGHGQPVYPTPGVRDKYRVDSKGRLHVRPYSSAPVGMHASTTASPTWTATTSSPPSSSVRPEGVEVPPPSYSLTPI